MSNSTRANVTTVRWILARVTLSSGAALLVSCSVGVGSWRGEEGGAQSSSSRSWSGGLQVKPRPRSPFKGSVESSIPLASVLGDRRV